MAAEPRIARRDWWTRARVRITTPYRAGNPLGLTEEFQPGDEWVVVQWGRAGREVVEHRVRILEARVAALEELTASLQRGLRNVADQHI